MKLMTCVLLGGLAAAGVTGARAQDPCSTATAAVTITDLQVGENTIDAKGTWQVEGAAGVLLEYRIDSDRMQSESRSGAAGSWDLTLARPGYLRCGPHTLRVIVFPSVQAGARLLHCLSRDTSTPRRFEVSCAPIAEILDCQWHCTGGEDAECTGVCTAEARRGRVTYVPFWGVDGAGWQQVGEGHSKGPWTFPVACVPGQKISFKVRDRDEDGPWSEVDEIGCGVTE